MNCNQSSKQPYNSSNIIANHVNEVITVPTFKPSSHKPKMELNVHTLSEASIDSLRCKDPFMYYSLFTASDAISKSKIVSAFKNSIEQGATSLQVERRSCVSAECDAVTFLARCPQELISENNSTHEAADEEDDYILDWLEKEKSQ